AQQIVVFRRRHTGYLNHLEQARSVLTLDIITAKLTVLEHVDDVAELELLRVQQRVGRRVRIAVEDKEPTHRRPSSRSRAAPRRPAACGGRRRTNRLCRLPTR